MPFLVTTSTVYWVIKEPRKIDTELQLFLEKMTQRRTPALMVSAFTRMFLELVQNDDCTVSKKLIDPVEEVPDFEALTDYTDAGRNAMKKAVVIKLNGGLGTSMGMDIAKSLMPVKNQNGTRLRFLDIIARQILDFRKLHDCYLPILFMNSLRTQDDTRSFLQETYPELFGEIPIDFLQHLVPKVSRSEHTPTEWMENPELEWYPPGHGDLYLALYTSGLLDTLLDRDYEYAFISNADNLGAVMDYDILGYFAENKLDFLMEVADRTHADKKGGHLARMKDGRLMLREVAQCPDEELEEFQDISIYKYFNTNSLWINLQSLARLLQRYSYNLPLPTIMNHKTVDPKIPMSTEVIQLETAMGSAISLFDRAEALRVPRTRFAPVKTTDDILGVWSDAYTLTAEHQIIPNPARGGQELEVSLDKRHYKFINQLFEHFPEGAPSLVRCNSLQIHGNYFFGKDVQVIGNATLNADDDQKHYISDGSILRT